MNNKKDLVTFIPKDLLNSIQADMFQLEHTKMSEYPDQSVNKNLTAESEDNDDLNNMYFKKYQHKYSIFFTDNSKNPFPHFY